MIAAVIGTGYLGRAICRRLELKEISCFHTFHTNRYFHNSVSFDVFRQQLSDCIDLSDVDVVVVASKPEVCGDTAQLVKAMGNLFDACRNKRVIYLSSDAVFDGCKGHYKEDDAPNPVTPYGKHKKLCEELLADRITNLCILRTSHIYGYSCGELDRRLGESLALVSAGNRLTRFTDMFKSPVEVNQFAAAIVALMDSDFRGILHVPGERKSVFEFTRDALDAMGADTRLLSPVKIPANAPSDYLRDTSLDSSLMHRILDFKSLSPKEALRGNDNFTQSVEPLGAGELV